MFLADLECGDVGPEHVAGVVPGGVQGPGHAPHHSPPLPEFINMIIFIISHIICYSSLSRSGNTKI